MKEFDGNQKVSLKSLGSLLVYLLLIGLRRMFLFGVFALTGVLCNASGVPALQSVAPVAGIVAALICWWFLFRRPRPKKTEPFSPTPLS
jgi:hypothetical protein